MATEDTDLDLWDRGNVSQQDIVNCREDVKNRITKNRPALTENVEITDLWPYLRSHDVVNERKEQEIKLRPLRADQVGQLMDHLGRGPIWRLHAFFRACVLTNQPHVVSLVGLIPGDYTLLSDPPPGTTTTRTSSNTGRTGLGCKALILAVIVILISMASLWIPCNIFPTITMSSYIMVSQETSQQLPNLHQQAIGQEHQLGADGSLMVSTSNDKDDEINEPESEFYNVLKAITNHRHNYESQLMTGVIFDIDGDDPDAEVIDLVKCYVEVDAKVIGNRRSKVEVSQHELFDELHDKYQPISVKLSGPPGAGKSTYFKYLAYSWSIGLLPWEVVVYVPALSLEDDVWEAVRNSLWCEEKLKDVLIEYMKHNGSKVLIMFDGLDEVHNQEMMHNLQHFIEIHNKINRLKILVSARPGLLKLKPTLFQRSLVLHGYTLEQGLNYTLKYSRVDNASSFYELFDYAKTHRDKLQAILCNPLLTHIFSVLATKGELDIGSLSGSNVHSLMGSLERFVIKRQLNKHRDQPQIDIDANARMFYRLCLYGMTTNTRLEEEILVQFGIRSTSPYQSFLTRHTSIDKYANKLVWYTFSHQMIHEYFAAKGILEATPDFRESLLLFVCSKDYLRNVQKMIIEIIVDPNSNIKRQIIRGILIFQQEDKVMGRLHELALLRQQINSSSSESVLLPLLKEQRVTDHHANMSRLIWSKVNKVFKLKKPLQESHWFEGLYDNGVIHHVYRCLKDQPRSVQRKLYSATVNRLLPSGRSDGTTIYPVGHTRWARVRNISGLPVISAWCPADAQQAIQLHVNRLFAPTLVITSIAFPVYKLEINFPSSQKDDIWGKCPPELVSESAWKLLLLSTTHSVTGLHILSGDNLDGLLLYLQNSKLLSHQTFISAGKIRFENVLYLWEKIRNTELHCKSVVNFMNPEIIIPDGDPWSYVNDRKVLDGASLSCKNGERKIVFINPIWTTENGDPYKWPDIGIYRPRKHVYLTDTSAHSSRFGAYVQYIDGGKICVEAYSLEAAAIALHQYRYSNPHFRHESQKIIKEVLLDIFMMHHSRLSSEKYNSASAWKAVLEELDAFLTVGSVNLYLPYNITLNGLLSLMPGEAIQNLGTRNITVYNGQLRLEEAMKWWEKAKESITRCEIAIYFKHLRIILPGKDQYLLKKNRNILLNAKNCKQAHLQYLNVFWNLVWKTASGEDYVWKDVRPNLNTYYSSHPSGWAVVEERPGANTIQIDASCPKDVVGALHHHTQTYHKKSKSALKPKMELELNIYGKAYDFAYRQDCGNIDQADWFKLLSVAGSFIRVPVINVYIPEINVTGLLQLVQNPVFEKLGVSHIMIKGGVIASPHALVFVLETDIMSIWHDIKKMVGLVSDEEMTITLDGTIIFDTNQTNLNMKKEVLERKNRLGLIFRNPLWTTISANNIYVDK